MGEQDERAPVVEPDDATRDEGANADRHDPSVFGRRATAVLLLTSVLGLVVFLFLVGAAARVPSPLFWASAASVVLTVVTAWVVAAGIGRGSAWAPSTALVLLALMFVGGLLQTVLQMASGSIRIPLDSLLAWWAIAAADRPVRLAVGRPGAVLVAAALASSLLVPALTVAQGATAVGRDDLRLTATIDCSDDRPLEPGDRATLRITWSWARDPLVPPIQDAIRVEWHAATRLVADERASVLPAGAALSASGPAMDVLTLEMAMRDTTGVVFGFDPSVAPAGEAAIVLEAQDGTDRQIADIVVTYARGDAWTVVADTADCLVPWEGDDG